MNSRFLIFLFIFFTSLSPVLAVDPIIIDQAIHEAPPAQADPQDQVNHFSNDTASNGTTCDKVFKISNSFQPKTINSQDTSVSQVQPYFVDEIKGSLNFTGQWSNTGTNWLKRQIANRYSGTLSMSDSSTLAKAFTNFDATKGSASNATVRSLPYSAQLCYKGKRLSAAIEYALGSNSNSIVNNEAVACYRGRGVFDLLPDNKVKCSRGNVITLTDIAHFLSASAGSGGPYYSPSSVFIRPDGTVDSSLCGLSSEPAKIFYSSDSACDSSSQGFIKYEVSTKAKYTLTGAEACYLFKHLVQPVDIGSNAQKVRVCSIDKLAGAEDCKTEDRSMPSGNTATNKYVSSWTIPFGQTDQPVNVCQTAKNINSVDRPNEFNIFAFIRDAFGWIKDTAQTFSGGVHIITKIDTRIVDGIARDTTFVNNLLPQEQQTRFQTTVSSKGSSDNGRNIDPGDPLPRTVLNQNLLPANFF